MNILYSLRHPILRNFPLSVGKRNLELLNLHFAPMLSCLCCRRARSSMHDDGIFFTSTLVPHAGPGSPSQHWGGNEAEEQSSHPKGEIICSLCPFLEKKVKKSFLQWSLLLVTPFVERSLAGAAGKKQNVFSKGSLKRGREGGEKN